MRGPPPGEREITMHDVAGALRKYGKNTMPSAAKLLSEAEEFLYLYYEDGRYRAVRFFYNRDTKILRLEKIDLGHEQMGS